MDGKATLVLPLSCRQIPTDVAGSNTSPECQPLAQWLSAMARRLCKCGLAKDFPTKFISVPDLLFFFVALALDTIKSMSFFGL